MPTLLETLVFASRFRESGFAGQQAQQPPRGAGSDTQCATVWATFS